MSNLGHVSPFGPTSCKQRTGRDEVMRQRVTERIFAKKVIWAGKELSVCVCVCVGVGVLGRCWKEEEEAETIIHPCFRPF